MNILLINYMETTAPGGINKVVREIAKNLSKMHKITVIQPNPLNLPKKEFYDGFNIIRIDSSVGKFFYEFNPKLYFYLKEYLKKIDPDIVHVHGYHTLFSLETIFTIYKTFPKVPIIFSPHYGIFSHNSLAGKYLWDVHNLIGRYLVKHCDWIIAASNFEASNIHTDLHVPNNKIMVISHGVDTIDLKSRMDGNKIKILYVGYLLELKGIQYIVKTLNNLINKNINVNLTIIGEGPYEKDLKKMVNKSNLDNFIEWKEFIHPNENEKLQRFFRESDVLLLLSKSENYGIVVTEALAMGTPVIVTKRTALNEFINEPGCYGVEYPPNPCEVADLIIDVFNSDQKVGPFSNKIQTWDLVSKEYETLYENLTQGRD
ncbi:MAG: hypothetical protein CIT01_00135 [Methanobacterium sp. BRmetb2]|nr:MAG: hypothetical protein CIT01_00135 [Methanobacterium sp. BRmetb2]